MSDLPGIQRKSLHFLVVDDISAMRWMLRDMLRELGFEAVDEASSIDEVLDRLQNSDVPYDFLITDWVLGGLDGLALLQRVRQIEALKDLPVLIVTAEAQKQNVLDAARSHVDGYLVKPFSAQALDAEIFHILARRAHSTDSHASV
jgi:two-component system chemotaxis response regulator CheY